MDLKDIIYIGASSRLYLSPAGQIMASAVNIEAVESIAAARGTGKQAAPKFSVVAYSGAPISVPGLRVPAVVDYAGLKIGQRLPVRMHHDPAQGVGHTESVEVRNASLSAKGLISRATPAAKEFVASAGNGFPWMATIGLQPERYDYVAPGDSVSVNGSMVNGPVNVIRAATLREISFVDSGDDHGTSVSVV